MSSSEAFYILNPYNDEQVKKLSIFEKENDLFGIIDSIKKIRSIDKETYLKNMSEANEIEEILFSTRDDKVVDCCFIQAEKDIKVCRVNLLNIKDTNKRRYMPIYAKEYAFDSLGMEEVFIEINPDDKVMQKYLRDRDFECLGENEGKIVFIKDKEEIKERNGMRHEHN